MHGKESTILHPITYRSGLFRDSQLNWAPLTKGAYAINLFVKKLLFYLDYAGVTLRSDHLSLQRFLKKNTLNSKVNKWAEEIEHYQIKFKYLRVIKNTLVDAASRLAQFDLDVC